MVQFKLDKDWKLTEEEIAMLEEAEKAPIKFDEDCPESTPEMLERFAEERRVNPLPSHVMIPVSPTTEKLIEAGGAACLTKLGKLIDDYMKGKIAAL